MFHRQASRNISTLRHALSVKLYIAGPNRNIIVHFTPDISKRLFSVSPRSSSTLPKLPGLSRAHTVIPQRHFRVSAPSATYSTGATCKMSLSSGRIKVLVAGGAYAGLSTALNLIDLGQGLQPRQAEEPYVHHPDLPTCDIDITVVDERDGFYHLIGTPLALSNVEYANKTWVKFEDIPAVQHPNIRFIQGSLSKVDCATKTATVLDNTTKQPTTYQYDFFVSAAGLRRAWPTVPQSLTKDQYLLECEGHIKSMESAPNGVIVVGGGAVGIEMAAELAVCKPEIKVTLVHSRDKLLSSEALPDEIKDQTVGMLKDAGVEVLFGHRLSSVNEVQAEGGQPKYNVEFTNGHKMTASKVINAISKGVPSASFLPSTAVDEKGYVKIEPNLNFRTGTPNNEWHYCAGDAMKWSGIKRCGGAMLSGSMIAQNIHQRILQQRVGKKPKFLELEEIPPMIALAVGKNAIASRPGFGTFSGPDVMARFFGEDLGFQIVWDIMQMGGRTTNKKA